MPVIDSALDTGSAEYRRQPGRHDGRWSPICACRPSAYARGGGEAASAKTSGARQVAAARKRVRVLLDPLSPFLEIGQFAAFGQYKDEVPAAGIIAGIGGVSGSRMHGRRQRRHGEGRHLFSADGEKASARAGNRAAEQSALRLLWWIPGVRICPIRTRCFPIASISAAFFITRRQMSSQRHQPDCGGDGLVHGGRRLCAGDVG